MITREAIVNALKDPEAFKRIFKEVLDVRYAGEKYSDQIQSLIAYMLLHTEEFDRLINDRNNLIYLAEQIPQDSADAMIRFIIRHPEEFDRLIKNVFDLKACAKSPAFKNFAGVFNKPTLATARDALKDMNSVTASNHEILQAVRYLSLGMLDEHSPLNVLPAEMIILVSSYMRDPTVHTPEYARKAARKIANTPITKK